VNYLVTGGTGFIGRFLIQNLLARKGAVVHALIRESSKDKLEDLRERTGGNEENLIPVWGDITDEGVIAPAALKKLKGKIDHVFHLAAVYDMNMDDATADKFNNEGTRNVVQLVNNLGDQVTLHHASSVAVAGRHFVGTFTEEMFDEGQSLDHPYYRTKYQSEAIVREECTAPWRIYRPGMVVGSSETGEMDKIDGPYYFFKTLQKIRDKVPKWLPFLGIEGGSMPVAPVDYVANAMAHIAHQPKLDGKVFHLVQSPPPTIGDVLATFLEAGHGPEIAKRIRVPNMPRLPKMARNLVKRLPLDGLEREISKAIGVPISLLTTINYQAVFDDRQARAALKGSRIKCPELHEYADKLWQYWEYHMDYDSDVSRKLAQRVRGQVVLITGGSSGIGFAAAKKLAAAGARVILVARTEDKLKETQQILQKHGGLAYYYPCDLSDLESIDAMADQVLKDHGHVDILINNAGRSIRRAVFESFDRFHDFERTMQLNYFGAVRLIMKLLPSMSKRKRGQIINISSIGVLANAARFSAYVASKSALDAFSRCLSAEVKAWNIDISTIYMPLVRTPMIAPTKLYDYVPTYSPEDAANMVCKAIVEKSKRIKTPLGATAELSYALWPKINDYVLSRGYLLFPSSSAAKGGKEQRPTAEGIALATVLRGAHL
jgi:NAD(P)-dependent dehydrogenase (short-subunit alcohol dehydrogenase family)